jgi:transporter family-2 protein
VQGRGNLALIVATLLGGAVLPVQAAVNARLGGALGNRSLAAFISFLIGMVGLAVYILLSRGSMPSSEAVRSAPWWAWIGGFLGALYVTIVIIAAPRIGVATLTGLAVAGQMAVSAVLDHWGLLGLPVNPVTPSRAFGLVLIVVGVLLLQRR